MELAGLCIRTNDVRRLAAFYKMILETTSDCDDEIHQEICTNGAALAILKDSGSAPSGRGAVSMVFTVDDVDRQFERLKTLGVDILNPPTVRPWGAKNMEIADPDGNPVVFRSFPHTEPQR